MTEFQCPSCGESTPTDSDQFAQNNVFQEGTFWECEYCMSEFYILFPSIDDPRRLIIDAAAIETDECPDCAIELEGWKGDMGEQKECPDCGERYVIESTYWLSRVDD